MTNTIEIVRRAELKKVGEISADEIAMGWKILSDREGKAFLSNSAFLGIKKSAALVGGSYGEVMYLPHRLNLNTGNLEVYEGDFLVGGLDPNIHPPKSMREQSSLTY